MTQQTYSLGHWVLGVFQYEDHFAGVVIPIVNIGMIPWTDKTTSSYWKSDLLCIATFFIFMKEEIILQHFAFAVRIKHDYYTHLVCNKTM